MPDGVTMVGLTTRTPGVAVGVLGVTVVVIFCVAAAAAARAAIPLICPPLPVTTCCTGVAVA